MKSYREVYETTASTLVHIAEALAMVNGNGGWTCDEMEAVYNMYRDHGLPEQADALMHAHAEHDEDEDDHLIVVRDGRWTWARRSEAAE